MANSLFSRIIDPIVSYQSTAAIVLLAALMAGIPHARSSAATYWSQTYGGPGTYEQVLDMRQMPDGSIIVGGTTDSFGTMTGDAWWFRIDGEGAVLDERVHGNGLPGAAADIAIDVDGGMAVVGAHTLDLFSDRDAWIHHVDANGNIDWQWRFDADPGMHAFYAIAPTSGDGYIATGSTAIDDQPPIYAWAVKFDALGTLEWQQRYIGGMAEHANFVIQTSDGGFALAGWSTSSGAGMTDAWLLKLSSTGAVEWQKTYGGSEQEEVTGLIQTADGGYALSAWTSTFSDDGYGAWVLRLDAAGEVIWQSVVGNDWADFRNIMQTSDGDLLATGRISAPSSNELWLVKLSDVDGELLWQRKYEGDSGDWGSMTVELAGGDLLTAAIWAWGFAAEDIWLQRTPGDGLIEDCDLIVDTNQLAFEPMAMGQDAITLPSDPPTFLVGTDEFVSNPSAMTVDEKCRTTTSDVGHGDFSNRWRLTVSPNPVQDRAVISFQLDQGGQGRVDVYDIGGRHLHALGAGTYQAGRNQIPWDAARIEGLSAGVYLVVIELEGMRSAQRVTILR